MSQNDIKAGGAYVELSLRDKTDAALLKAEKRLKAYGASITEVGQKLATIGVAGLAGIAALGKAYADLGSQLVDVSARTGVAVEALSELKYAAEQSATNLEGLELGLKKLSNNIVDAANGSKSAIAAFQNIGVSVADLIGLKPDEQFKLIADKIAAITDPAKRTAAAMDIFGKAGTSLIPLMAAGSKGIEELQARARKLGLSLSGEDAAAAEAFGDTLDEMTAVIQSSAFHLGASLAPALKAAVTQFSEGLGSVSKWLDRNRESVTVYAELTLKVLAATAAIGGSLIVIGTLTSAAGTAIGVVRGLGVALTFIKANPFVLVAAGAVAAVAAISQLTNYTADLKDEMGAVLDAGDEQRQRDQQRLNRLAELSQAERLASGQQQEAKGIVAALSSTYGELGIQLDATTGKLTGVADATTKVAKAMQEAAVAELNAKLIELKSNLVELGNKKIALQMDVDSGVGTFGEFLSGNLGQAAKEELRKVEAEFSATRKRIEATGLRLEGAKGGDKESVVGAPAPAADPTANAIKDVDKLNERLKTLRETQEKELTKSFLSEMGLKTQEINDSLREQLSILDQLIQAAPNDNSGLDSAEVSKLANQKVEAEKRAQALIENVKKEYREKAAKEEKEKSQDQHTFVLNQLKELAEAKGDQKGVKFFEAELKKGEFEKTLDATFGKDEDAKEKARQRQKEIQAKLNAAESPTEKKFSSAGLFNTAGLQAMVGNKGIDAVEKNTANSAKYLKQIADAEKNTFS